MFDLPFIDLPPLRAAAGTVRLPGSKSISNRVLLLAGLSAGTTVVHDLLDSDDTRVMLTALAALGCEVESHRGALHVGGLGGRLRTREARLFLGNAGTAMRPLCAALALLAARQNGRFELTGTPRMHERPIGDLVGALRRIGCRIDWLGADGFPPLRVEGSAAPLALDRPVVVRGDVSSQFLTALLLALPLAGAAHDVVVEVDGELISKPYVGITLALLERFGVAFRRDGWQRFTLPAGSSYRSPGEIRVEADASSASYFIALGAIAAIDAPLRIEGVGLDSIQGDIAFVDAARAMGAAIEGGPGWLEVRRGRFPLAAIEIDANAIPDAAMTLAAMALYAEGTTRLERIASWRVKETDRLAAMAAELRRLGATAVEGSDFLAIRAPDVWRSAAIRTYDDHRIAMCFALAAFNGLARQPLPAAPALPRSAARQPPAEQAASAGEQAASAGGQAGSAGAAVASAGAAVASANVPAVPAPPVPVRILEPRCVGKTFPDYFETLFGVVRAEPEAVPVITVDGPTASGKGTVASAVAAALGYRYLDSGAVYRATALAAMRAGVADDDEDGLAAIAAALDLRFEGAAVRLGSDEVTEALRLEAVGALASKVSAWPKVRTALVGLQLSFRRVPGLVADGRDMGTVVFPGAALKIFMTASAATRAERRHAQLRSMGVSASIPDLLFELQARDDRDRTRNVSPLKPAQGAVFLDNSALSAEESVEAVLRAWRSAWPVPGSPTFDAPGAST